MGLRKPLLVSVLLTVLTGAPAHGYSASVERARDWLRARTSDVQFRCAHRLWDYESSWYPLAGSPSGAYGIPQALPGRKMRSAEKPWRGARWDNWRTDPLVQVAWGRRYVSERYGSFCAARRFQVEHGWY